MDKLIVNLKDKIIVYPTLDPLNITPTINSQHYEPQEGYAYNEVNISGVTSAIDNNIIAENIKKDVSILGVIGSLESSIAPTVENETLIYNSNASVNGEELDV